MILSYQTLKSYHPRFFLLIDQSKSYASITATNQATVSFPERVVIQKEASCTPVRYGIRQINNKYVLLITTNNRFKILEEKEKEDHETRLIGGSIVREQLQEFCRRTRTTNKWMCMPGDRLNDISAACNEATSMANNDTVLIIHSGTNDIMNTRSEKLLEIYRHMIHLYKRNVNLTKSFLQEFFSGVVHRQLSITESSALINVLSQGLRNTLAWVLRSQSLKGRRIFTFSVH